MTTSKLEFALKATENMPPDDRDFRTYFLGVAFGLILIAAGLLTYCIHYQISMQHDRIRARHDELQERAVRAQEDTIAAINDFGAQISDQAAAYREHDACLAGLTHVLPLSRGQHGG